MRLLVKTPLLLLLLLTQISWAKESQSHRAKPFQYPVVIPATGSDYQEISAEEFRKILERGEVAEILQALKKLDLEPAVVSEIRTWLDAWKLSEFPLTVSELGFLNKKLGWTTSGPLTDNLLPRFDTAIRELEKTGSSRISDDAPQVKFGKSYGEGSKIKSTVSQLPGSGLTALKTTLLPEGTISSHEKSEGPQLGPIFTPVVTRKVMVNGKEAEVTGTEEAFDQAFTTGLFLMPKKGEGPVPEYSAISASQLFSFGDQKKNTFIADYLVEKGIPISLEAQDRIKNFQKLSGSEKASLREELIKIVKEMPDDSQVQLGNITYDVKTKHISENTVLRNMVAKLALEIDKEGILQTLEKLEPEVLPLLRKSDLNAEQAELLDTWNELEALKKKYRKGPGQENYTEILLNLDKKRGGPEGKGIHSSLEIGKLEKGLGFVVPLAALPEFSKLSSDTQKELALLASLGKWKSEDGKLKEGGKNALSTLSLVPTEKRIAALLKEELPSVFGLLAESGDFRKQLRLLYSLGKEEEAVKLKEELLKGPPLGFSKKGWEERLESEDFYARKEAFEERLRFLISDFDFNEGQEAFNAHLKRVAEDSALKELEKSLVANTRYAYGKNLNLSKEVLQAGDRFLQEKFAHRRLAQLEIETKKLEADFQLALKSDNKDRIREAARKLSDHGKLLPHELSEVARLSSELSLAERNHTQNQNEISFLDSKKSLRDHEQNEKRTYLNRELRKLKDTLKKVMNTTGPKEQLHQKEHLRNEIREIEGKNGHLSDIEEQNIADSRIYEASLEKLKKASLASEKKLEEARKLLKNETTRVNGIVRERNQALYRSEEEKLGIQKGVMEGQKERWMKALEAADAYVSRSRVPFASSPESKAALHGLLKEEREQALLGLRSAGMSGAQAESILSELESSYDDARKKSDQELEGILSLLQKDSVQFDGKDFRFSLKGEVSSQSLSRILSLLDKASVLLGQGTRAGDTIRMFAAHAASQGFDYYDLGSGATLKVTDRALAVKSITEGRELEGVSLISNEQAEKEATQLADRLKNAVTLRDKANLEMEFEGGYKSEDYDEISKIGSLSDQLARFGNVKLENVQHLGVSVPSAAFAAAVKDSHADSQASSALGYAAYLDQEDARIRTYVKTGAAVGVLVAAAPFTGGTSLGFGGLLLASATSASTMVLLDEASHLGSYAISRAMGEDTHLNWVAMDRSSDRAAVLGAVTPGFGKVFAPLNAFGRVGSTLAGAATAGSSAVTTSLIFQDSAPEALHNLSTALAYGAVGGHLLPKGIQKNPFAASASLAVINPLTSLTLNMLGTELNGGQYVNLQGQAFTKKDGWRYYFEIVKDNLASDLITAGTGGRALAVEANKEPVPSSKGVLEAAVEGWKNFKDSIGNALMHSAIKEEGFAPLFQWVRETAPKVQERAHAFTQGLKDFFSSVKEVPPLEKEDSSTHSSDNKQPGIAKSNSELVEKDPLFKLLQSDPTEFLNEFGRRLASGEKSEAIEFFEKKLLPQRLQSSELSPSDKFIRDSILKISLSQKRFDELGNYQHFIEAVKKAQESGKTFDLAAFEPFWPNHGMGHADNIAHGAAELSRKLGDDVATQMASALFGLAHDMGMFKEGKSTRENHPIVAGQVFMGLDLPEMGPQKELVHSFIQDLIADTQNPLRKLFLEAASSEEAIRRFPNLTPSERMENFIREFVVGTASHGNYKEHTLDLGVEFSGQRRDTFLALLLDPKLSSPQEVEAMRTLLKSRYGDNNNNFMFWLNLSEEAYQNNPGLKNLRDTFVKAENRLNMTDADRPRGSNIKPAGGGQPALFEGENGPVLGIAVSDPQSGIKALLKSPSDRLGSFATESYPLRVEKGADGKLTLVFSSGLSPLTFENPNTWKQLSKDAARVIGETAGYQVRAGTNEFGHNILTEVNIPKEFPSSLHDVFKEQVVDNFIKVNIRNADSVLLIRDETTGKSPIEVHQAELSSWLGLPKGATKEQVALGLKSLHADLGSKNPETATNARTKLAAIPAGFKDSLKGKFIFITEPRVAETSVSPDANIKKEALRNSEEAKWGKDAEVSSYQAAYSSGLLKRNEVEQRLIQAGAPREPRKVKLADGSEVDYKGPGDLIPDDAKFIKLKKGAQLTELGADPYYGYLILSGKVKGFRSDRAGEAPFELNISADPNQPATVIGFTSWFNIRGGKRNASVFVESDELIVIAIPKNSQMEKLFSGPVMAQTPEELARTDAFFKERNQPSSASKLIDFMKKLPGMALDQIKGNHDSEGGPLGNAPLTKAAQSANIDGTGHKQRDGGEPYPAHPNRLAIYLEEAVGKLWKTEELEQAMAIALVHDFLEEGPGPSLSNAQALRDRLLQESKGDKRSRLAAFSALLLTEPLSEKLIQDLTGIKDSFALEHIPKLALIHQVTEWSKGHLEKARPVIAAAIADKMVNLFDYSYITDNPKLTAKEKADKLAFRFKPIKNAFDHYGEVVKKMAEAGLDKDGSLQRLMAAAEEGMRVRMKTYGVDAEEVKTGSENLEKLFAQHLPELRRSLRNRRDLHYFNLVEAPQLGQVE